MCVISKSASRLQKPPNKCKDSARPGSCGRGGSSQLQGGRCTARMRQTERESFLMHNEIEFNGGIAGGRQGFLSNRAAAAIPQRQGPRSARCCHDRVSLRSLLPAGRMQPAVGRRPYEARMNDAAAGACASCGGGDCRIRISTRGEHRRSNGSDKMSNSRHGVRWQILQRGPKASGNEVYLAPC